VIKTKEDVKKESLRSLRPITTMYVICNFCWFVMLFHEWAMVIHGGERNDDLPAIMSGKKQKSYLKLATIVLYFLSSALTPILHFTCSYEMRQGLYVLLHGSRSVTDYTRLVKHEKEERGSATQQKSLNKLNNKRGLLKRTLSKKLEPEITPRSRRIAFQLHRLDEDETNSG